MKLAELLTLKVCLFTLSIGFQKVSICGLTFMTNLIYYQSLLSLSKDQKQKIKSLSLVRQIAGL